MKIKIGLVEFEMEDDARTMLEVALDSLREARR